MLVVKGIYEHGVVRLLDPLPDETVEPAEVLVTFDGPARPLQEPADPEALKALEGIIGLLNDLTPEESAEFNEAAVRKVLSFGHKR